MMLVHIYGVYTFSYLPVMYRYREIHKNTQFLPTFLSLHRAAITFPFGENAKPVATVLFYNISFYFINNFKFSTIIACNFELSMIKNLL